MKLVVNPKGANLSEVINGVMKDMQAGEVFEVSEERGARLLSIEPSIVFRYDGKLDPFKASDKKLDPAKLSKKKK